MSISIPLSLERWTRTLVRLVARIAIGLTAAGCTSQPTTQAPSSIPPALSLTVTGAPPAVGHAT